MNRKIKEDIAAYYDFWFGANEVYEKWAKARGLTANALFVLYAISECEAQCTQRLICEKLLLPKQTVNGILDGFEKKGYVEKIPSEQDKRNKLVAFTEAGKEYAGELLSALSAFEERALLSMDAGQRQSMLTANQNFLEYLRNALKEEGDIL